MSDVTKIVVFSLVASVVVVIFGWFMTGQGSGVLKNRFTGGGKWEFSKSWGANLTLVGGILATTLASKAIPDKFKTVVLAGTTDYISVSLLFVIIVVVAPFVNAALVVRQDLDSNNDRTRGWAVLLAFCLTLWGVIGQLGTVGLVFYELKHAHVIPPTAAVLLWIVIGAALVLVVPYTAQAIRVIVKAETAALVGPAPTWSLP